MSLLLLLGPNAHPPSGTAHGAATVAGNFPGRLSLAMGAAGVATSSASLGLAIRFKQSATGTATSTASTLSVPVTALAVGDLVVVAWAANFGPNSVTGTGVTFTSPSSGGNFYYGKVTSAGGTGITVNWTAGTPMNVHVMVFANADVALDDKWSWTGNNVTNKPTVASGSDNFGNSSDPVAAGNLVVAMAQWNTSATLSSTGSGFTSTSADIGATTTLRSVAAWQVYGVKTSNPQAQWTLSATTTWQANAIVIVPTQSAPPPAPKNLRAYHTNLGVTLTWDIVGGATAGYKVYDNGVLMTAVNGGNTTGASTFDSASTGGLVAGSTHSYTVRAVNAFGESPDSNAQVFIAAACPTWTTRNKYPATNPPTAVSTTQSLTQVGTAGQAYVLSVVIHDGAASVTGVTGGGATWQRAGRQVNPAGTMAVELWYALGVAAGSDTITATVSSSVFFNIDLAAVSNVAGVEGFDTHGGSTLTTSGVISLPVSPASTDGAFFIAVVGENDAQFTPESTPQSLAFGDNVMSDGGGFTSKTWFVQGLGAGTDARLPSGLTLFTVPNASWASVSLIFTRAKVQLASTPGGTGGGAGALGVGHSSVTLAATPASVATAQGVARITRQVTASVASVGASSATVRMTHGLASSVTGLGVVASAIAVSRTIAASAHGAAATSGATVVRLALVGSSTAGGATGADVTVTPAGMVAVVGGAGAAAGSAGVAYSVTVDVAGQSAAVAQAMPLRGLLGAVAGTGAGAADVALRRALVAAASGDAGCVVSTGVLRAMSANSSAIATAAGGVRVRYALSSALSGVAATGAVLTKGPLLAGRGDGSASGTGAAHITHTLAAATTGHGLVTSTMSRDAGLAGAIHGASTTLPAFGVIRPVVGSTAGSGSAIATGALLRGLQGEADGQAGQSVSMVFRVRASARADGSATTSGAVLRDRGFVVTAGGVAGVAGTLWDVLPQIAGRAMALASRELSPTQRLVAQGTTLILEARGAGEGVRALDRTMTLTADASI